MKMLSTHTNWLSTLMATAVLALASGAFAEDKAADISALLNTANTANGKAKAQVCAACHSFDKGGANKIGPNLWEVVNRSKASVAGFSYSQALLALKDQKWTVADLNNFLFSPMSAVHGTKMPFAGIKNTQERADIIAWLETLSDAAKPAQK